MSSCEPSNPPAIIRPFKGGSDKLPPESELNKTRIRFPCFTNHAPHDGEQTLAGSFPIGKALGGQ
jgi:hypothetical protein